MYRLSGRNELFACGQLATTGHVHRRSAAHTAGLAGLLAILCKLNYHSQMSQHSCVHRRRWSCQGDHRQRHHPWVRFQAPRTLVSTARAHGCARTAIDITCHRPLACNQSLCWHRCWVQHKSLLQARPFGTVRIAPPRDRTSRLVNHLLSLRITHTSTQAPPSSLLFTTQA